MKGLRKRLRAWRKALRSRSRRLQRRAKEIKRIRDRLSAARRRLREWQESKPRTNAERERKADRVEALQARIEHLTEELAQARSRRRRLRAKYRRARRAVTHLRNRIARRRDYASVHFRYDELACRDGTPVPTEAYEAVQLLCRTYLEPARKKYGAITVTSGYRTEDYNRSIGGASNSVHIYDRHPDAAAVDHYAVNAPPSRVADFLDTLNPGGLGRYASFTHVDNRQRLGWSRARWSG